VPAATPITVYIWGGALCLVGGLGITASYEEWLDEFIMINNDPHGVDDAGGSAVGSPLTRREYYEAYCNVDPKKVYRQHADAYEANRLRGAVTGADHSSPSPSPPSSTTQPPGED